MEEDNKAVLQIQIEKNIYKSGSKVDRTSGRVGVIGLQVDRTGERGGSVAGTEGNIRTKDKGGGNMEGIRERGHSERVERQVNE